MSEVVLEGIESLRIVRADSHVTIRGAHPGPMRIECSGEVAVSRDGAKADISLPAHAELRMPSSVAIEVSECSGNLEIEDIAAPIIVGRIAASLRARSIAAVTVRDRIGGSCRIEDGGAMSGGEIAGSLLIESVRSATLGKIGGNVEAKSLEGDLSVERVGGNLFAERIGGAIRAGSIGGKLHADRAARIEVESIGGKARIIDAAGDVRIGRIGGRAAILGASGDVAISSIGGHASLSGIAGSLDLPEVNGAMDLRGPFPPAKTWNARGRGRIHVEIDNDASLDLSASAGWGRVRMFGLDAAGIERIDRGRIRGPVGIEKAVPERTRMTLETRHADIILARAGAEREYCRSGRTARGWHRFPGPFEELGDILAEEFGEKIPEFVSSILGAAGHIVMGGRGWSAGILRETAAEAMRAVRDALGEAERAFDELGENLPRDIAASVEEFGRRLAEILRRAAAEGRMRSREGREETGERIREAALKMRDSIRAAVGEARARHAGQAPEETGPRTRPFSHAAFQGDIMDILKAVRDGKLDPEEADEMIAALMEVEQAGPRHPDNR